MHPIMLITGASRGIGAATARLAARHGYAVCINYLNNHVAAETVRADIEREGGDAMVVQADVSQEADVLRLFAAIDRWGQLACVVNNAGILETQMRLEDMSVERLQRVMAANVTSTFLCCREAVKRLSTRRGGPGGSIVNISSGAARSGSPNEYIDYAASKGAVDSLTLGLAKEVAAEGIRVNGVRPGFIYTDIHTAGGEPGRVDRLAPQIPLQRGGYPEEVAEAILWLASDKASYTTGSFIDVLGGR
ncbi:sugar dehydrogenase [Pokkaliibacter plantistimulans]|uniref:Sugar dehydrogenase n=2 Tax=Pseudomonadota TaxID=1224 RepID=A0ABX5LTB3_9GAMM|nr:MULTISPECIES: SDR family oxidoreductase [Pokkaliibacter]MDH2433390.1 SDR family oxidoreductase [Pokkaliibacter sp. MBI-7]PPC78268.1 oxidoreductase [Pokkaliibacter plantistimulans]PXF28743.1 sugar dehydrogenase [Pokkaliibacter plantistimulans]